MSTKITVNSELPRGFDFCASGSPPLAEIAGWLLARKAYGGETGGIDDVGDFPTEVLQEADIIIKTLWIVGAERKFRF